MRKPQGGTCIEVSCKVCTYIRTSSYSIFTLDFVNRPIIAYISIELMATDITDTDHVI